MNAMNAMNEKKALACALAHAGLEQSESRCLYSFCRDGLYQIGLWTPYLKYEFYLDAVSGEVLGLDTEPIRYPESLGLICADEGSTPFAA